MPRNKPLPRAAVFACLLLCPLPLAADEKPAAEVLARLESVLGAKQDYFARLKAAEAGGAELEYFYFRSDARSTGLLYQASPALLAGYAYLLKGQEGLQGYNPDYGCAFETDYQAMRERAGFSFAEINPRLLAAFTPRGNAIVMTTAGTRRQDLELGPDGLEGSGFRLRLSVDAKTGLPLSLTYLDGRGAAARIVRYLAYYEIGGKYFPRRIRVTEPNGLDLVVEASETSYHPIPDFVFTQAYLDELAK